MNARIKELAIEAGLIATMSSDHEGFRDFDYRKFAELIIQECMTSLDAQYVNIVDDADFSDNKIWISAIMNTTVDVCKHRIQNNFGVEK